MTLLTITGLVLLSAYVILGYKRPSIGFITAPFVAVVLVNFAVFQDDPAGLLVAGVFFLIAMISVAASRPGSELGHICRRWAFRVLVLVVLVLGTGLALMIPELVEGGAALFLLLLLSVVVYTIIFITYAIVARRGAVLNVFSTIGSSMRQNLPLPMALDCAAAGGSDTTAWMLRRIKTWLVKGYPLSEAIRRGFPRCPARALAMLSAGERIGQLPAAIHAVELDLRARAVERTRLRPIHPAYPVIVLTFLFLMTMGLLTFVIPQFKAVLEEMVGGQLPVATRILIEISQKVIYRGYVWVFLALFVLLFVYLRTRRRRPEKPYLLSWVTDALRWYAPIFRWFQKNRSMVQVVELLRMSLNAGCPVNEAIRGTLGLDVNLLFRRRLACWLRRVERGDPIGQSARRCGLGNALAWAFDSGAEAGSTPAVLEMLEAHYRSNYSYRVNLTRFILWPMGTVLLGATVGFVVFAVFSPLVMVITSLCGSVYP